MEQMTRTSHRRQMQWATSSPGALKSGWKHERSTGEGAACALDRPSCTLETVGAWRGQVSDVANFVTKI